MHHGRDSTTQLPPSTRLHLLYVNKLFQGQGNDMRPLCLTWHSCTCMGRHQGCYGASIVGEQCVAFSAPPPSKCATLLWLFCGAGMRSQPRRVIMGPLRVWAGQHARPGAPGIRGHAHADTHDGVPQMVRGRAPATGMRLLCRASGTVEPWNGCALCRAVRMPCAAAERQGLHRRSLLAVRWASAAGCVLSPMRGLAAHQWGPPAAVGRWA